MDSEGKVEYRSSLGQLNQLTSRREDIDFILIKIHLEILHQVDRIVLLGLQGGTHRIQELIQPALSLDPFVLPVGGQSSLSDLVHPFCADLNLHPFVLRSHHGDVQALVAVTLRDRDPVFHAFGVGLVHIRNDGIDLPAFRTLLLWRGV